MSIIFSNLGPKLFELLNCCQESFLLHIFLADDNKAGHLDDDI